MSSLYALQFSHTPKAMAVPWYAGLRWVCDTELTGQGLFMQPVGSTALPFNQCPPLPDDGITDVIIYRAGGIGDLLVAGCIARALRSRYGVKVGLACNPSYQPIFDGQPDWDYLVPTPIPESAVVNREVISFQMWIEFTAAGRMMPMADVFLAGAQVRGEDDAVTPLLLRSEEKIPRYVMDPEVAEMALNYPGVREFFAADNTPIIGIQWESSSPLRTLPPSTLKKLITLCLKQGWKVALFGAGEVKENLPSRTGMIDLRSTMSFMATVSLIQHCASMVVPDSAYSHLCGALGVKCNAYFGPFDPALRVSYYPTVRGHIYEPERLKRACAFAPCGHHERFYNRPPGACQTAGHCTVMQWTAEEIIEHIKEDLK